MNRFRIILMGSVAIILICATMMHIINSMHKQVKKNKQQKAQATMTTHQQPHREIPDTHVWGHVFNESTGDCTLTLNLTEDGLQQRIDATVISGECPRINGVWERTRRP